MDPRAPPHRGHSEGRLTENVLAALPKRLHADPRAAIAAIYSAETRANAITSARVLGDDFAEYPKATKKIPGELDTLLAFYDYPAEHWTHLRATNLIESTFATVRLRTRVTKDPGSRAAGLAMAFKLLEAAESR